MYRGLVYDCNFIFFILCFSSETGAIFTFGRSKFGDGSPSKFWIRDDKVTGISCGDEHTALIAGMFISLRFSSGLPNVVHFILLSFGPHMKCKKIQRTIGSLGVLMDLGDEIVFLVYHIKGIIIRTK